MKKIIVLVAAAMIGGGIFTGTKLANADTEKLEDIKAELQVMQQSGPSVEWINDMEAKYGDDWDDLLEAKYGDDWDAELEAKYGDDWDELFDDNDDLDDIEDKDDDMDDDHDDIDDHDDLNDKDDDSNRL